MPTGTDEMLCTLHLVGGPFDGLDLRTSTDPADFEKFFVWTSDLLGMVYVATPEMFSYFLKAQKVDSQAVELYSFQSLSSVLSPSGNSCSADFIHRNTIAIVSQLSTDEINKLARRKS